MFPGIHRQGHKRTLALVWAGWRRRIGTRGDIRTERLQTLTFHLSLFTFPSPACPFIYVIQSAVDKVHEVVCKIIGRVHCDQFFKQLF